MNKNKILFILTIFLFSINCQKEASKIKNSENIYNVKIKAGIVMKSGDIKNIARQNIYILKLNIIPLIEANKETNIDNIKRQIKSEANYENKMVSYDDEKKKLESSILTTYSQNKPFYENLSKQLNEHFLKSFQMGGAWGVQEYFRRFNTNSISNYDEIKTIMDDAAQKYIEILNIDRGVNYKEAWTKQYDEFKKLKAQYNQKENEINVYRNLINKVDKEKQTFIEEIELKATKYNGDSIEKNKKEFQAKIENFQKIFIENTVLTEKTNLNGEANIKINGGTYYLFLFAELADNKILWNYPLNIEKDNQYIEISNDNAIAINGGLTETIKAYMTKG
jgi:hypothetical protein